MRLGAHVSVRGSLAEAVERARALGCDCFQIFVCNPRQWRGPSHQATEIDALRDGTLAHRLAPLVAHASYLVNLASPDESVRARSVGSVVDSMRVIGAAGGEAVVTHIGSALGAPLPEAYARVARSVGEILARAAGVGLLLENSAGTTLGASFEELAAMLAAAGDPPRAGICLDTAHLHGAGWELGTATGWDDLFTRFDRTVGLARLGLFHLNDSRALRGSRHDRHENIGQGAIGRAGFRALLAHEVARERAGILEVPGFAKQGPDRKNLSILRALSRPARLRLSRASRRAPGPAPNPCPAPAPPPPPDRGAIRARLDRKAASARPRAPRGPARAGAHSGSPPATRREDARASARERAPRRNPDRRTPPRDSRR